VTVRWYDGTLVPRERSAVVPGEFEKRSKKKDKKFRTKKIVEINFGNAEYLL
jgi:hypothetical protein